MRELARKQLLEAIGPGDLVLDIGGWADPFARADWVLDLMPYETRGMYERMGWVQREPETERFTRETWIERDLCDREPYPFADNEVDFVICSQTLEDLRDPIWVCQEMNRIGKAGYIEVPSRLEEQSWGVNGAFVGWSHHRWMIDVHDGAIEFVIKLHSVHAHPDQYFPAGFWERLTDEERVQTLWWRGQFGYRERVIIDAEESTEYLRGFVAAELARRGRPPVRGLAPRRRLGALRRRLSAGS